MQLRHHPVTAATALAVWGTHPSAAADDVLTVWREHGPRAGVRLAPATRAATAATGALAGLPGDGEASGPTALLLPLLRGSRAELVLPRPGDTRGLAPSAPALLDAGLRAGAAVLLPEVGVTVVPVDDQWWVWPVAAATASEDAVAVREQLDDAVQRAALMFARHELGIEAADARDRVEQWRDALALPLPASTPSRAGTLFERVVTVEAILAVAGRDTSAAVTAGQGAAVDDALAPLRDAARAGRRLAVQLTVHAQLSGVPRRSGSVGTSERHR